VQVGIVGGGPAGISAATFLKRAGVNVIIFEKKRLGGLLNNAWRVENIPIIVPQSGKELTKKMISHLKLYKVDVLYEKVEEIYEKRIVSEKGTYDFDFVIASIGTIPNRIKKFEGNRVAYEFLDLPSDINLLAIYGAGDVAFDGAIQASILGKKVHIFNRSNNIRALSRLVKIAKSLKVNYHENEAIKYVEHFDEYIRIYTEKGNYKFDALLLAVGRKVDLSIVKSDKVPIIGDVAHPNFRQASIAIADGINIAMKILGRELSGNY